MSSICIGLTCRGGDVRGRTPPADVGLVEPHSLLSCLQPRSSFDWPCLRTRSSDFTTATVMDGKSEPPAGIWGFLISTAEKGKQVGGGRERREGEG